MLDSEKAHWQFAHEWYADLDLTVAGVPLGDTLEYDMLAVLNRAVLTAPKGNDDETKPAD